MCWNEDPKTRPSFSELRARFDSMLLAERKDAYIDLRINSDKPYYLLDTNTQLETADNFCLCPSPVPGHHSFLLSQLPSKEGSPKPLPTPDFSPSRKSQKSCSSAQFSPTAKSHLMRSTSSVGTRQNENESHRRISVDHARENGRPSSLLLPRERERREKQNPYVEEPSRAAAVTLAPPTDTTSHTRGVSDGAIEMSHLNGVHQSMDSEREKQTLPEIQITTATDDRQ